MTALLASVLLIASFGSYAAGSMKCIEKAEEVILKKGKSRGETTTLRGINLMGSNDKYEGYDVFVTVTTRRGMSFNQVCRIILKKSNCSYDNTYGCAATVEELDAQ